MLRNLLPWLFALWGVIVVSFGYGFYAGSNKVFPYRPIEDARQAFREYRDKVSGKLPWYYLRAEERPPVILYKPGETAPGLTLISGVGENGLLFAELVDPQGRAVHRWDIDWFHHWPDNTSHIPGEALPKSRPGTHLHGVVLSQDGDLTFNFERLGLVQLDFCGRTKWRLPRRTHHSLVQDENGDYWTQEVIRRTVPLETLPNFKPPFDDNMILKISPDGKVLKEIPLYRVLQKNGYQGLLYMATTDNWSTAVTGDVHHFNDVEIFPSTLTRGYFKPGDVMVSPRNINAIIVFDPETEVIKHAVIGRFVRQHDPDFIDGSTISVFDNNNIGAEPKHASSRVVEYSFQTGATRTLFEGNASHPFFTDIMGKHQHLQTGGMLLVESRNGRVLEVNADGDIVWEFNNLIGPGLIGLVDGAERIPPEVLSPDRLAKLAAACSR